MERKSTPCYGTLPTWIMAASPRFDEGRVAALCRRALLLYRLGGVSRLQMQLDRLKRFDSDFDRSV
jgi:hypothetical protein